MSNPVAVQHKRSKTAGNKPTGLLDGEIGVQQADGLLFWIDSSGALQSTYLKTGTMALQSASNYFNSGGAPLTSQVLRAARTQFTNNGGLLSNFLGNFCGNQDGTDGTWEAANVATFAPVNGVLYGAIQNYVTTATTAQPAGLGLSSSTSPTAATVMSNIWANAPGQAL